MESSGSCSPSTAPTFLVNTSLTLGMAIRDEDNKLGHNSPASSRAASSASNKKAVEGVFKCKLCPRAFKTARARGGHQKAHSQLRAHLRNKMARKGRRAASAAWSPAPIWPSSYATALRSACLRAQPFRDWRSHYDPLVHPMPPSFPWQTGTVGLVPLEEPADGIDLTLKLWN